MKSPNSNSSVKHVSSAKLKTIRKRLANLYGVEAADSLVERFFHMIGRYGVGANRSRSSSKGISQKDAVLITYADMVSTQDSHPLSTLREFCTSRLKGAFSAIHILPFIHGLQTMVFQWLIIVRLMRDMGIGKMFRNYPKNSN